MFTMVNESTRQAFSAVAAVAVVAFSGLALEQGHLGSLPQGTVEVGELTPVNLMQMAAVTLPEIVVTAERVAAARVAESRDWTPPRPLAAKAKDHAASPRASSASVLLK
jgi:hypothetical protein